MIQRISRRFLFRLGALGAVFGFATRPQGRAQDSGSGSSVDSIPRIENWFRTHDRVWTGGSFWANPMEDWEIEDGAAVCSTLGSNRSIHSLTHQVTDPQKGFEMSVVVHPGEKRKNDGGGGFRLGVRSELNEVRSNCLARGGMNAGLVDGALVLGPKRRKLEQAVPGEGYRLHLAASGDGDRVALELEARSVGGGTVLARVTHRARREAVLGNVAVVSHFKGPPRRNEGKGYGFSEWRAGGDGFTITEANRFGPILWSMYSLSDSRDEDGFVMKLSALTGPLGQGDNHRVELQVERDGEWRTIGEEELDPDAWVALFEVRQWNEKVATPFRVRYREEHTDGAATVDEWTGVIRANPEGCPLRLGALTCQNDYGFPYAPVAENLIRLDPDMLYFSGDQLYESHGGFGIIRDPAGPAILNYLRKFYQFGWAFREPMRNAPTYCIPDDHDVFQGNIWGEGGAPMQDIDQGTSSKGGYREPARMVNVVHRTNAGHHPAPYDPTPCLQDISVYYGEVVYGGVGFAILGDRQWKSGPERVETGSGRADHVLDPEFDTARLDQPGLELLGERQEKFLEVWGDDWRGHGMKVLLSQTVFAGVATHHGKYDGYLKADLDSGAWPQTARNRAVDILRKSKALHVNGDQHLTTLSQYGVAEQRDANWSFCTPAIAAGYPRWWRPDEVGMDHANRPAHGREHTGEYLDGFGNRVYVYAVGNPEVGTEKNRYDRAHQKGSGFGIVEIDTERKTYTLHSYRFLVDATAEDPENQFPGWPVTIHREENAGENRLG